MIFQHTWTLVVDGHKTQTRRLIKGRIGAFAHAEGMDITYHELGGHKVGQRLHVMPCRGERGIKKVADIEIVRLRREDVRYISDADAIAEGFQNRVGFLKTWCEMHDPKSFADAWTWDAEYGWLVFLDTLKLRDAKFYDAIVLDFRVTQVYADAAATARALLAKAR